MSKSLSERKWAENQVFFKQANEKVSKGLRALKRSAEAEGYASVIGDIDSPLYFYCECSDENCRQRIVLKPSKYKALHKNNSRFIIVPGHEVGSIERVVLKTKDCFVTEKHETPPEPAGTLNSTSLNNV